MASFNIFILLALVLVVGLPHETYGLKVDHASVRQNGCTGLCFRRRFNAIRQCAPLLRAGGLCTVDPCTRRDGNRGYRCTFMAPPPAVTAPPPTVITAPVVVVAPTMTAAASPSTTGTPAASPSVTPSPSASPTTSATSSVTPTPSVTPSTSPDCSFVTSGPIGGVATNGVCTCGTSSTTITVYAEAINGGGPLPNAPTNIEARDCYRGCINDLIPRACDPGSFATFATDGQAIVDSCCNRCVDTTSAVDGMGVNAATNQCFLDDA